MTDPSTTAREELNGLLSAAIDIGLKLIGVHGNHIPFALVVHVDGKRENIAADNSDVHDGALLAQTVMREVQRLVDSSSIRALAFAQNIDYLSAVDRSHVDAIEIDLDHIHDEPVTCLLPYTFGSDRQPMPGEFVAIEPRKRFFRRGTLL